MSSPPIERAVVSKLKGETRLGAESYHAGQHDNVHGIIEHALSFDHLRFEVRSVRPPYTAQNVSCCRGIFSVSRLHVLFDGGHRILGASPGSLTCQGSSSGANQRHVADPLRTHVPKYLHRDSDSLSLLQFSEGYSYKIGEVETLCRLERRYLIPLIPIFEGAGEKSRCSPASSVFSSMLK